MKIQNEQLEALLRQQELAARAAAGQKSDGNAFAAALAEQLSPTEDTAAASAQVGQTAQASQAALTARCCWPKRPTPGRHRSRNCLPRTARPGERRIPGRRHAGYVGHLCADPGAGDQGSLKQAYELLQGIDGRSPR